MAGTTTSSYDNLGLAGAIRDTTVQLNKLVDDVEKVRAGAVRTISYTHGELAAGAGIAARAVYQAKAAETVLDSVVYIPEGNSAGVNGSNTLVLTLRNITEGVDIATVSLTTNLTANTPQALTLTAANADIASGDVLGIVVTQGALADVTTGTFQFDMQRQTIDAAADLTACKIGVGGTAIT